MDLIEKIDMMIELGMTEPQMQFVGHGSIKDIMPGKRGSSGKFQVKYKMKKNDKNISVAEYPDLRSAKQFLAVIKKKGGNGIISKNGKVIKEGMDDFTGIVTKSLPFYMKGAQVTLKKKGSTFYAGVKEAGSSEGETKKFKNKDDAMRWISGFGIKGLNIDVNWDWDKAKPKF
jgi:hypothetical protein